MRLHHSGVAVSMAALLSVTGCLMSGHPYRTARLRSRPVANASEELDDAPAPAVLPSHSGTTGKRQGGRLVAGLNAGFMISEGVGPGAELTFTRRMDDFIGIRFSVGHYGLSDGDYETSLTPILVRAVFSTPLRHSASHRSCLGLGAGFVIADEIDGYYPPYIQTHSSDPVYIVEWGREHVMEDSRTTRIMAGFLINDRLGGISLTFGMDFGG